MQRVHAEGEATLRTKGRSPRPPPRAPVVTPKLLSCPPRQDPPFSLSGDLRGSLFSSGATFLLAPWLLAANELLRPGASPARTRGHHTFCAPGLHPPASSLLEVRAGDLASLRCPTFISARQLPSPDQLSAPDSAAVGGSLTIGQLPHLTDRLLDGGLGGLRGERHAPAREGNGVVPAEASRQAYGHHD